MPSVKLFKQDGTSAGEVSLKDELFGIEPNNNIVFDVVTNQQASLRQGTHAVKTEVLYVVGEENHGVRKVLVVLVLDQVVRQSGVAVG